MEKDKEVVLMSAEEKERWDKFQEETKKKEAEARRKSDLAAYGVLVDEAINCAMPVLESLSSGIADTKASVINDFKQALELKRAIFGLKDTQASHTFTNSDGTRRIIIGNYQTDDYRDTVVEGIQMVREAIESLGKDAESKALVNAVFRLLSRDQNGTLKASRVLQLRKLAIDSGNERFIEGVKIIEESYQPAISKQYIKAQVKVDGDKWKSVPLGMTEA